MKIQGGGEGELKTSMIPLNSPMIKKHQLQKLVTFFHLKKQVMLTD